MKTATILVIAGVIYGLSITNTAGANNPGLPPGNGGSVHSHNSSYDNSTSSQSVIDGIDNDSRSDSTINDSRQTLIQIRSEWKEAAQAVSSLNLAYCSDGGSAGDRSASFNVAGVSYVCEVAQSIPQMLSAIPVILKAAESYPDGSEIQKYELDKAKRILNEVAVILGEELPNYIHSRAKTAPIGAFFRDTWFMWGLLLIAL